MIIAIAQINSVIGDFAGNRAKIAAFAGRAKDHGADMVLFPELALCGYPPMDLLDQDRFVELNIRSLRLLQRKIPGGIACGAGYVGRNPGQSGKALVNAYGIILDGALVFEQVKTLLPTYDVFDEARNFEPANRWPVFEWKGQRIGVAICEDVWRETETPGTRYRCDPVGRLMDGGISLLCVPSASPYYAGKLAARQALAERICRRGAVPLVYVNAVGANDSIIFDGRSFVSAPAGTVEDGTSAADVSATVPVTAKAFEEDLVFWDSSGGLGAAPPGEGGERKTLSFVQGEGFPPHHETLSDGEFDVLEDALVHGIRDYMAKCGFARAHVGLSGGIDSALVAYLAVRAAGGDNVACFSMPSRFSSRGSKDDAAELAANLGCRYETLPIEGPFGAFLAALEGLFEGRPFDIAEENLQARIRGTLLMAYANKFNSMLLTTGNKSELAMGYCTLYGDTNGALGPIGDLFKTEVFALCRWINGREKAAGRKPPIPQAIIDKPPSAELRPNQKDEDSLPPYDDLDGILRLYLFDNLSADEITARGKDRALTERIIRAVARAEFKRRQAPPVLKVSPRAFGMGRRMPVARVVFEV